MLKQGPFPLESIFTVFLTNHGSSGNPRQKSSEDWVPWGGRYPPGSNSQKTRGPDGLIRWPFCISPPRPFRCTLGGTKTTYMWQTWFLETDPLDPAAGNSSQAQTPVYWGREEKSDSGLRFGIRHFFREEAHLPRWVWTGAPSGYPGKPNRNPCFSGGYSSSSKNLFRWIRKTAIRLQATPQQSGNSPTVW